MTLRDFHPGCHGIPERCFSIDGKPMRFCARCLGASIGHLVAIPIVITSDEPAWYYFLGGLMLMLADWTMQNRLRLYHSNFLRLITGMMGGFAVAGLGISLLKKMLNIL